MSRPYISVAIKEQVIQRAEGRCEYCKSLKKYSPQSFHIEHIIPVVLGGLTILINLAFACGGCNNIKYIKIEGHDPITGSKVSLFNPRKEEWSENFEWSADSLSMIGITAVGRASVETLKLNREELINLRELTKLTGEHPPH